MDDFPAENVPLNAIPSENYKVFELDNDEKKFLTTETEDRVFSTLHEGAIFLYLAETFKVLELNLEEKEVILKKEDVHYYTEPRYTTNITPLIEDDAGSSPVVKKGDLPPVKIFDRGEKVDPLKLYYGDVLVEHEYTKYVELEINTSKIINQCPLELPKTSFQTKALWFNIPLEIQVELDEIDKKALGGAIHAVEHGVISLIPKNVLCSRWDIGGVSIDLDPLYNCAMIYIYDSYPGGIGLVEHAKENIIGLLKDTLEMIKNCQCKDDSACPSCCQSPKCGSGNIPISKRGAIKLLSMLLENIVSL
ncbi:MAG: Zn-binding domain-containing protein [Candidatus Hodarchaeota archaeon]